MALHVYDTRTREKRLLKPHEPVRLTCMSAALRRIPLTFRTRPMLHRL